MVVTLYVAAAAAIVVEGGGRWWPYAQVILVKRTLVEFKNQEKKRKTY